jgi:hypothetical protein
MPILTQLASRMVKKHKNARFITLVKSQVNPMGSDSGSVAS